MNDDKNKSTSGLPETQTPRFPIPPPPMMAAAARHSSTNQTQPRQNDPRHDFYGSQFQHQQPQQQSQRAIYPSAQGAVSAADSFKTSPGMTPPGLNNEIQPTIQQSGHLPSPAVATATRPSNFTAAAQSDATSAAIDISNQQSCGRNGFSALSSNSSSSINNDAQQQQPEYNASPYPQYPSAYSNPPGYLTNPSQTETLKARNVGVASSTSAISASGQGYILNSSNNGANNNVGISSQSQAKPKYVTSSMRNNIHNNNNNGSIALLLLPPLILLLLYEMPSSLPLLLFLFIGLLVYALDLANVGSVEGDGKGFYTLGAVWFGWVLLSMVVAYVMIVLGDGDGMIVLGPYGEEHGFGWMALWLALAKAFVSVMLLFCVALWVVLQFKWLPIQLPTLTQAFERILHFTLPPISAATVAYGTAASSLSSSYISLGLDTASLIFPHVFAFHLALGILLLGTAPSMLANAGHLAEHANFDSWASNKKKDDDKTTKPDQASKPSCAINSREGKALSIMLVFAPPFVHLVTFRQRIAYAYASWDDLFDFVLIATVPYILHYLLASNGILDERWRRSLMWLLKSGTSPIEGGRTLRGAVIPMAISLFSCIAFQQRYLIPLCARASYIVNGHEGIISPMLASTFLTLGTVFGYASVWFFGRKSPSGEYLLGEYHEDAFQVILGASAVFFGMSCSPPWTFLPVPMLAAESLALWVITKQLRYAFLMVFVLFTVGTIIIAYRLTFLSEYVEIFPGKNIVLKSFAHVALLASLWLIFLVGLVHRTPGGYATQFMKNWDVTGVFFAMYGIVLVVMEFALLREPMPLYSRDSFEVGRVAVYSPATSYFTGFLIILIASHMKRQKLMKVGSFITSVSIAVGKTVTVLIESSILDGDDSLQILFLRWIVASALLFTISAPYAVLKPHHMKMTIHAKRNLGPSGKPGRYLPNDISLTVLVYSAVVLPLIILVSVPLVIEPFVGILSGHNKSAYYATSPSFSEVIGYSSSLWGVAVLSMTNHFLPDGGADLLRRVSALIFLLGIFISFSSPAIPGTSVSTDDSSLLFQSVSSLEVESSNNSGGWGLISAFLAILLAMTGPLELREVRDASGRKDSRQLLRLMIFGVMFGCGLSWFFTMQSMSKDIFIPIFVTSFSCMAMSFLGTVATVMGYFLETKDFLEAEQIANVWAGVGFPVFFVISSVSLSAHAHPFGIGGWASTYLSVCGLCAGAFTVMVRLRDDKNSITRGYGNASCIISWLCAITVVYGRYGVAGVGVVGVTSVAGIPMSILGTILCSPILLLLEGEHFESSRKNYQIASIQSKKKEAQFGLILRSLTRSNRFAPLLAGTIGVFVTASFYAIFLRGCGVSRLSFLFGAGDVIKSQADVFSHVYGKFRTTRAGSLDDVATMAKKSIVHTRTMIAAARLSGSGLWTAKSFSGPLMNIIGLLGILPGLQYIVKHSWSGSCPPSRKVMISLPLNVLAIIIGRGIPSLVAAAVIGLFGGIMQLSISQSHDMI
mmetsp:Transcript_6665/g.13688  ORF Transcript_6665/g.13688 Transcript_6665/m.13688 type:complete len:1496 (+) Transcript_6665:181-4668(+)